MREEGEERGKIGRKGWDGGSCGQVLQMESEDRCRLMTE